jgi:hypothetical protein
MLVIGWFVATRSENCRTVRLICVWYWLLPLRRTGRFDQATGAPLNKTSSLFISSWTYSCMIHRATTNVNRNCSRHNLVVLDLALSPSLFRKENQ